MNLSDCEANMQHAPSAGKPSETTTGSDLVRKVTWKDGKNVLGPHNTSQAYDL